MDLSVKLGFQCMRLVPVESQYRMVLHGVGLLEPPLQMPFTIYQDQRQVCALLGDLPQLDLQ